ncbi:hypothetical protein ACFX11_024916 [Malus domestica]
MRILLDFEELQDSLRRERFGEVDHGSGRVTNLCGCSVSLYGMLMVAFTPATRGRIAVVESVSYLAIQDHTAKRLHFASELVSGEAQQGEDRTIRIRAAFGGCSKHSSSMGIPQPG